MRPTRFVAPLKTSPLLRKAASPYTSRMTAEVEGQRETWWTRPAGGREVFRLALPLIISTGSWSLMMFVDRMFLLWHSADEMGAAMPAGMLHWSAISFAVGVVSYVNTFVAQYYGAKQYDRIGAVLGQGMWLSIATIPFFLLLIPLCPMFFARMSHDAEQARLESTYLQVLLLGSPAVLLSAVQASYFTGRGFTRVVMFVDIVANLSNCVLDPLWIFGYCGFPEGGIAGAAAATVVSEWAKVVIFWWLMRRDPERITFGLDTMMRFDWGLMKRLLWFGGSSGVQFLVEGSAFTVLILCISAIGKTAMNATTLAFTINSVAFVPMIGIHIAVSTLVGQKLGDNRPDLASRATWSAFGLAIIYTSFFVVAYLFFPGCFLTLHQTFAKEDDFATIQPLTIYLLRFVAVYCLFDAMQLVFVGAIKGAGDTTFVLLNTVVVSTIAVSVGRWGEKTAADPLTWWWGIATAWICTLGTIYCLRFLHGKWRSMRVIEEKPVEPWYMRTLWLRRRTTPLPPAESRPQASINRRRKSKRMNRDRAA